MGNYHARFLVKGVARLLPYPVLWRTMEFQKHISPELVSLFNRKPFQGQYPEKSKVVFLKKVSKGTGISYGRKYITPSQRCIATVSCGYADGYPWNASSKAYVLVKGHKVPVVGSICMDQLMIDITGIDVKKGDEVVLIGDDSGNSILAEDVAGWADTIPYEIITRLSLNIPRIYVRGR